MTTQTTTYKTKRSLWAKYPSLIMILTFSLGLLASCKPAAPSAAPAQPTAAPGSLTQAPEGTQDIQIIAQELVQRLVDSEFETATQPFDAAMQKALPASKLEEVWGQLTAQVGAYQRQIETQQDELQGYRRVHVISQFENANIDVLVVFNSEGQISGLFFSPAEGSSAAPQSYQPPDYVDSSLFTEQEVTVGAGKWALPGTLTLPRGDGQFPALVLVHGSGPNDRDETIGPNKPFRDLAWGLASQGIAVLRYDKRTLKHANQFTGETLDKLTVQEETIEDALLAAELLRSTEKVNPQRVFVAGHSLGGTLIPRIGQQDPSLSGLVVLAGATRPLEDLILDQTNYLVNLDSVQTDEELDFLATTQAQVAAIKDPDLSENTPSDELPLGIPPAYWLDLRGYLPAEVAKSLTQPLLILQGGRDYQVSADKDFAGWKTTLEDRADTAFTLYPDLNHLFISGEGPSTPEEYQNEGHVSPQVIADIAAWINTH
jgi:hypothetical protein